jgi:hypothetical protein
MRKLTPVVLLLTLAAGALGSAQASVVHALGDQDPSGFNVGGSSDGARGWRFSLGVPEITVTELGLNTPQGLTNSTRVATLWDFTTSTILAQTAVGVGAGWVWTSIAPVTLSAGHDYLVSYWSSVADYYYGAPGSSWLPNGDVVYQDMRYCNSCTADSVSTNVLNGYQYGLVDIGYTVGAAQNVPEPGALSLVGLALVGLALLSRRKA